MPEVVRRLLCVDWALLLLLMMLYWQRDDRLLCRDVIADDSRLRCRRQSTSLFHRLFLRLLSEYVDYGCSLRRVQRLGVVVGIIRTVFLRRLCIQPNINCTVLYRDSLCRSAQLQPKLKKCRLSSFFAQLCRTVTIKAIPSTQKIAIEISPHLKTR